MAIQIDTKDLGFVAVQTLRVFRWNDKTYTFGLIHRSIEGIIRLTVSGKSEYPVAGDVIETHARLRLPVNFRAEGSFNYEQYLMKEGIHALGSVKSSSLLHITDRNHSVLFWFSCLRTKIISRIRQEFPPQEAAILRALWMDDRSGLSRETEQILMDAGVFHVIAISGFHIAIVLLLCFLFLKKLVSFRLALLILAAFLLFYFFLLEGRSSITRSFLMFLILAVSVWRYETPNWANVLFLSALLQLIFSPLEIFDPGYQLTYLSTAAILFIAVPLIRKVHLPRKVYQFLFDFLVTTSAIQFVLLPYQAYFFHKITLTSLLANWTAVPASSCLIGLGLILVPFPFLYGFLSGVLSYILQAFTVSVEFFGDLWLGIISQPAAGVVAAFYLSLVLVVLTKRRFFQGAGILSCGLCLFLVFHPFESQQKNFFRIHFVDVGQGDAILLEYPDGTFDLVDGGGFWNREALDIGESVLIPYLSSQGVDRINRVFLTHAHADHMNGLFSVFKYLPVRELYVSRKPLGDIGYQGLMRQVQAFPRSVKAGDRFYQAGVFIEVLAPEDTKKTMKVANDDSLVLLLKYHGKRVLLTGDAEKRTEDKLLNLNDLEADYLKAAHHGSRSSSHSAFLDKLKMKIVFISVGRYNWFGHPHPEVLNRFRSRHVLVYRTDQLGTIRLTITGDRSAVTVWTPVRNSSPFFQRNTSSPLNNNCAKS